MRLEAGHREASRCVRGGTAKAQPTQWVQSSTHQGLSLRVSSILTVASCLDGETEAQSNARVYCVWVAQSVRGRQEAKARSPVPPQMITAGKPVGGRGCQPALKWGWGCC